MKVEVKPISRKRWHKKTGKESFTRPKKIEALVDSTTMRYSTGLSEEDEEKYGKILKKDLSGQYTPGEAHPFWTSKAATVSLENNTMFFDTEIPLDYLKINIMKASKYVANSLKEYEQGLYPEATHVIFDEVEEIEAKASKVAQKKKAILECANISKSRKAQFVMILKGKNVKGKSDDFVEVLLDELIEENAADVILYLNRDKEYVAAKALVLEALQKSVLRKKGHKIYYMDSMIGNDIEEVVNYFIELENQELKLRIMEAVN